jgi:acyl carrier protein
MNVQSEAIEKRLKSIILDNISSNFINDEITDESDLGEDLMLDSLSIMHLFVLIEEEFEIQIEDDFLFEFISKYKSLKNYVIEKFTKKNGGKMSDNG